METAVVKARAGEGGLIDLILGSMKRNSKQDTMLLALLGIWVIFSFVTDRVFLTPRNLSNLFVQTVTTAILAVGMVLVIVAGHIGLSVGSVLGFAGAVCALCMIKLEWGVIASVTATMVIGLAVGAWHGFWIAYRKVPAFIVTLASMLAFRGLIIGVTGGQTQGLEMASEATAGWVKALGPGDPPTIIPATDGQGHATTPYFTLPMIAAFFVAALRRRAAPVQYGLPALPFFSEGLRLAFLS